MHHFINIFNNIMFCYSKRHGKSDTRFIIMVMEMGAESTEISSVGKSAFPQGGLRDGIQEQVILLNQLSMKLDEYFALRTFGPERER